MYIYIYTYYIITLYIYIYTCTDFSFLKNSFFPDNISCPFAPFFKARKSRCNS